MQRLSLYLDRQPILLVLGLVALVWLLALNFLMIADVWDETNVLLLLESEPVASSGIAAAVRIIWMQELPLDIYRPLAASLLITLGKLTDGDFILLRYFNALLVLSGVYLMTSILLDNSSQSKLRGLVFFAVALFSSSAVITAGWFANVFDATCLFFVALSLRLFHSERFIASAIAFSLAAFCKESYVLALPLFGLLLLDTDRQKLKTFLLPVLIVLVSSLLYWSIRHALVPVGSEMDLHDFALEKFAPSALSYGAGFLFQFSQFTPWNWLFWLGILSLLWIVAGIRNARVLAVISLVLLLPTMVYWGMFGYQGSNIITWELFVARLYLLPFIMFLFLLCQYGNWRQLALLALLSICGTALTTVDYIKFQTTYTEVYARAEQSIEPLHVHYPEKPLEDFRRGLSIGNFPDAELRINKEQGGLEQ